MIVGLIILYSYRLLYCVSYKMYCDFLKIFECIRSTPINEYIKDIFPSLCVVCVIPGAARSTI